MNPQWAKTSARGCYRSRRTHRAHRAKGHAVQLVEFAGRVACFARSERRQELAARFEFEDVVVADVCASYTVFRVNAQAMGGVDHIVAPGAEKVAARDEQRIGYEPR